MWSCNQKCQENARKAVCSLSQMNCQHYHQLLLRFCLAEENAADMERWMWDEVLWDLRRSWSKGALTWSSGASKRLLSHDGAGGFVVHIVVSCSVSQNFGRLINHLPVERPKIDICKNRISSQTQKTALGGVRPQRNQSSFGSRPFWTWMETPFSH